MADRCPLSLTVLGGWGAAGFCFLYISWDGRSESDCIALFAQPAELARRPNELLAQLMAARDVSKSSEEERGMRKVK